MGVAAAPPRAKLGFSASTAAAVGVAAAAMVATLPGRTHGLGLVTEPLLRDLGLDRVPFAALNFWATLVGAAFCLPVGWFIDRAGVRVVLAAVLLALGAVVVGMAGVTAGGPQLSLLAVELFYVRGVEWAAVPLDLFVLVLLTRGLGQSALSVVSLALVGKASGDRPGFVIGSYSFLVSIGFMAAVRGTMAAFEPDGNNWRAVWAGIGWVLVVAGVLALLFVRNPAPTAASVGKIHNGTRNYTLLAALLTPGFWVFALAMSFYGLVAAGMSLFYESLLAGRGFDRGVFMTIATYAPLVGLAANLATGWLATRVRLGTLLAGGLLIQTVALGRFSFVETLAHVYAFASAMAVVGGVVTVSFFTVWRQAFGPTHLGQIQGAAQLITVLASAAGPLVLAAGRRASGSYESVVTSLAVASAVFAVLALVTPLPKSSRTPEEARP